MATARGLLFSAVLLAWSIVSGCAGHAGRTLEARSALDAHQPQKALELYNDELGVDKGSDLPEEDDDNALLLLDRALILQELQKYADSSRDLETADKQVEMLDFTRSTTDEIGRYLFSDDSGPYKARPYEKLLVNTMNMVNYLARGDLSGAKIEARRFSVMQKYLKESEDQANAALLGPGSYLAGFVFEQAGDANEAIRYYDEALAATPYASLRAPVARLAGRSGYRSPRLQKILDDAPAPGDAAGTGEVLVVVSYGRVPALKATRVPLGLALTYASLYMRPEQNVAARRMAGQGLVSWVNYPELERPPHKYGLPNVEIDGRRATVDPPLSIDTLVQSAYEKAKGPIMASAIVRMIARGVVGTAAGVGTGRGTGSSAIGMLVALGAQATLAATDTPDTRCWATLPARIALVRVRLPAGKHQVRVGALGVNRTTEVQVRAGGFSLVSLTELSQL